MNTRDTNETNAAGGERYPSHEAVLLLQDWFGWKSVRLTPDNVSLIDDLTQEMSMGVLLCKGENTLSYYKQQAVFRARDFLRKEKRHIKRKERYSQFSHPITEDDDTPFIEGLVDMEDKLRSRCDDGHDIVELFPDTRACA